MRYSKEAVRKATGGDWSYWFSCLKEFEGKKPLPHKELALFLHQREGVDFWWAQTIVVEYEKKTGRRKEGEVEGGTFQIGVSKTLALSPEIIWQRLLSGEGQHLWLEGCPPVSPAPGEKSLSEDGFSVEIRRWKPGSHIRLRWKRPHWATPSTLQIRTVAKGPGKTTLTFHHEGLPEEPLREEMRIYWKKRISLLFC